MVFENTLIVKVETIVLTARDSDDGALTDKTGCFTDLDVGTSCEELTAGTEGVRVQFGIPITAVLTMTIRFWDDGAMTVGDWACIPYTDLNSVLTTNEIVEALVVSGATDFVIDASFKGDCGDADGAGNFAVRFAIANGSEAKPKASEIEYEIVFNTTPIQKHVYDDAGDPISGVTVKAYPYTGSTLVFGDAFDEDISDGSGVYDLDLYTGDWILLFFKEGGAFADDVADMSQRIAVTVP